MQCLDAVRIAVQLGLSVDGPAAYLWALCALQVPVSRNMPDDRLSGRFELGTLSPEEQEAIAARLPPYPGELVDVSSWPEQATASGFRIRLPIDVGPPEHEHSDQTIWRGANDAVILLSRHRGDGRTTTTIGFDHPVTDAKGQGEFRIRVAERSAALVLQCASVDGQQIFSASLDAGIHANVGVGFMVVTRDAQQRTVLISAIPSIVAPPQS